MAGLVNFIIDHINRGVAGDVAKSVKEGQTSAADAALDYTKRTGLPPGDLFAGAQQSALAKLAPSLTSMGPQDQAVALAGATGSPSAIEQIQALAKLKALAQVLGGGAPQPASVPFQTGSQGDSQPGQPVPQALPQQVTAQPVNPLVAALNVGVDPSPLVALQKNQAELGKISADTAKADADTAKAKSETITTPAGGGITPGQKKEDEEFAQTFATFRDSGGSKNTDIALKTLDEAINDLKTGAVHTGKLVDRTSYDADGHPNYTGKVVNPKLLALKSKVDSAVLPLLKPMFGARVTNFDAQSSLNSYGLNPMMENNDNIVRLEDLKKRLSNGQSDLSQAGDYFTKNGTLSGYKGNDGPTASAQPENQGKIATAADIAATVKSSGKTEAQVRAALQARGYQIK